MSELERQEIQGIVLSAYPKLAHARFSCLAIDDPDSVRSWLRELASEIQTGEAGPPRDAATNLAVSYGAMEKLGLPFQTRKGFSREFQEGMAGNDRRSSVLGDRDESDPARWEWGGPESEPVDFLLMLYAPEQGALERLHERHRARLAGAGLRELRRLDSAPLPQSKEHFGFRDGVSQPKIAGLSRSSDPAHVVQSGEFVLGYRNEHDQQTMSPMVDPIEDRDQLLPIDAAGSGLRDFGRNGSYLVFRQLSQDVKGLWSFIDQKTRDEGGKEQPQARLTLGAKMVGRWPSGAPLTVAPLRDDPSLGLDNDFRYHRDDDAQGLRCPVSAHIRRTNPRDSLAPKPGSEGSLAINRRHRMLRRGRPYGVPLDPAMTPEGFLASDDSAAAAERGLHFMCINANISRQFEFVQHTWVNNEHFAGLYSDTDPLIGDRQRGDTFTLPACPVRTRVSGLPRFVHVLGGGYFFLPSTSALRYLASAPRLLASEYAAPGPPAVFLPPSAGLRAARAVSDAMEAGISFSRRFTRTRRLFDRRFQAPITQFAQYWIQRRLVDEGLGIAEEQIVAGEEEVTQRITELMTQFLYTHYRDKTAERAGNTKTYGLVKAHFEVLPDLDDALRVGIFSRQGSYPAWVRFGGPGPLVTPDMKNNGVMSMGIKLMGVEGEKAFEDEAHTQDFTAISAPTFTTPTVFENLKLQRHIGQGTSVFYFINPFDSHLLDAILQGIYAKAHANPLEARFWSCVPYLFGEGRAIKFRLSPQSEARSTVPRRPTDDYLQEAMMRTLAETEVRFDFQIQFQTDPVHMPIENSSVIWPETLSPFIKVATLRIPPQRFDSPEQLAFARNLSFNPWHCIREHRPLGNQGRARKHIYYECSKVRQRINREERIEPTGHTL